MLIQVIYRNKKIDFVKDTMLEGLIQRGMVAAFRRLDGWVIIDKGPVRRGQRSFVGNEKRLQDDIKAFE